MQVFYALMTVLFVAAGVPGQYVQTDRLRSEFEYDPRVPLDLAENENEMRTRARIYDVSYSSLKGGRVTGYLVTPRRAGRFAGAIFLHPGPGNRRTFLDEAVLLADSGVVSLLIDAPYRRPEPWKRTIDPPKDPQNEREMYIQTVLDLRRGVDLLGSRRDVDPNRIGFVGHSFGATHGAVLAGVEKRIRAFVLIAGRPSLTEWVRESRDPQVIKARESIGPQAVERYLEILRPLDSVRYIGEAAPAALFFQFANRDESVPPDEARKYEKTVGDRAYVKWYDADHHSVRTDNTAMRDRTAWLKMRLRISD